MVFMLLHAGGAAVAGLGTKCYTNSDAALSLEGSGERSHAQVLCPGMSHWTLYGLTQAESKQQQLTTLPTPLLMWLPIPMMW